MPFYSTVGLAAPVLVQAATAEARRRCCPGSPRARPGRRWRCRRSEAIDPLAGIATRAFAEGEGYRLEGSVGQVLDLPVADLVIVPALFDGPASWRCSRCGQRTATGRPVSRPWTRPPHWRLDSMGSWWRIGADR